MKRRTGKRTIVFDLDGSLETPYFEKRSSRKVKAWMEKHPAGSSFDRMYTEVMADKLPHFFFKEFLMDCFGLYADVDNVKIEDSERWRIPVEPMQSGKATTT